MTRLHLLLVLCAMCIGWVIWDSQTSSSEQVIALATEDEASPLAATTSSYALHLLPRDKVVLHADLFDASAIQLARKKTANKAKKIVAEKQLKPTVEPLPFTYVGKWQEGDAVTVLVDYQNQIIPIHQGDVLIERYKVLAIEEVAQTIVVTFQSIADKTQEQ